MTYWNCLNCPRTFTNMDYALEHEADEEHELVECEE
jgi:hypothetical protein